MSCNNISVYGHGKHQCRGSKTRDIGIDPFDWGISFTLHIPIVVSLPCIKKKQSIIVHYV
jgi:hypothetical protein